MKIEEWLKSGEYLPPALRDFHDQKDTFKAIHELLDGNESTKEITWREAHCYVIGVFLWFMARRGYTLQRSRAKIEFHDLTADVRVQKERRQSAFHAAFTSEKKAADQ